MNKIIFFLIVLIAFQSKTFAQFTPIPDANFEQALIDEGIDSNTILDGQILTSEAMAYSGELDIANLGITNLTGIEAFTSITEINFNYNLDITSVDFTNCTSLQIISGVGCEGLTSANVTGLINLTTLNLRKCALVSIDVTSNTSLKNLSIRKNNLVSLDLSQNSVLENVDVKLNNLTFLDNRNGNQANMIYFDSDSNPNLHCAFFDDASLIDRDEHLVWIIDDLTCIVDNEAECSSCVLSINDTIDIAYNMYPNPVNSTLHVTAKADHSLFSIYSITGKAILTKDLIQNDNLIDVSSIASGIYLTRFVSENKVDTKKLIIQ